MKTFKESNIPLLIITIPIFTITILVSIFLLFFLQHQEYNFEIESKRVKDEYIKTNKFEIKREVDRASKLIEIKFANELKRLHLLVEKKVNSAYSITDELYNKNRDQKSEKVIVQTIKDTLGAMESNRSSGFYFVLTKYGDTVFTTNPNKEVLVTKNELDMLESGKKEGFMNKNRNFFDSKNLYHDITYLKKYSLFKWYIGYSDFVNVLKSDLKEELKESIGSVQLSCQGYLFIFELGDGQKVQMVINKNRALEGKMVDTNLKDINGRSFSDHFKYLLKHNELFIQYKYQKPKESTKREKISYFRYNKSLNWVVGAGFYIDDIEEYIDIRREALRKKSISQIYNILIISVIIAFIIGIISFIFSRRTANIFKKYKSDLIDKNKKLDEFNYSLEDKVEKQTTKIKEKSIQIYNSSREDSLTKLPNSIVFHEDLQDTIGCMIIILNIDHFDVINNTYGMMHGDKILYLTALKLKKLIPKNAKVYRLDSNEFAIIASGDSNRAKIISKKIDRYFEKYAVTYNSINSKINFTFGAAINEAKESVSFAKIALKEGKIKGRKRFVLYNRESDYAKLQSMNITWTHKLKEAIAKDKLVTYYQPIVDNQTRKVVKYEVLIRIVDGEKIISPFFFMEAAKTGRFLNTITKTVIEKSFAYFKDKNIDFSINLTQDDLVSDTIVEFLLKNARKYQIRPKRVTLEILENITLSNSTKMTKTINELKSIGYIIAIDDFGSESSNYSRLTEISANIIKIDGMYIKNIDTNKKDLSIVRSIIFLAKELGAETIAEFVHNEKVYNIVKKLGIDYSQGYYFAEPKPQIGKSIL